VLCLCVVLCCVVLCCVVLCCGVCRLVSPRLLSCCVVLCCVLSCLVLSFLVLPCLVVCLCRILHLIAGMVAAKILEYREGDASTEEEFMMTKEMGEVLANDTDSFVYMAGAFAGLQQQELSDGLVHAFKTGIGMSYRARSLVLGGEDAAVGTKRLLETWTKRALVQEVFTGLGGGYLVQRLRAGGGTLLDMGCGAGVAANVLAAAFPTVVIHGVDPDAVALEVGSKDAARAGMVFCLLSFVVCLLSFVVCLLSFNFCLCLCL
jgi:hypothetical protein